MVRPVSADRWDDLVRVFGRRGDDPSWCWCRLFVAPEDAAVSASARTNRQALEREIASAAVPPGLIAYVDERPVGWTRIGPRSAFLGWPRAEHWRGSFPRTRAPGG